MKKSVNLKPILLLVFIAIAAAGGYAQPGKLTKEQLGEQGNALLNAGKRQEAIDLVDSYPEYADEMESLYIKSVAYTELRDYKKADIYFQKQFDILRGNADSARADADEIVARNTKTKDSDNLAAMMYGASIISYASADMVNALRSVAFDKNGMPAVKRDPLNIPGYSEMVKTYHETSVDAARLQIGLNQLKDALANLNKAVELDKTDAAAYKLRAGVYRKLGKLALARADEAKARKLGAK